MFYMFFMVWNKKYATCKKTNCIFGISINTSINRSTFITLAWILKKHCLRVASPLKAVFSVNKELLFFLIPHWCESKVVSCATTAWSHPWRGSNGCLALSILNAPQRSRHPWRIVHLTSGLFMLGITRFWVFVLGSYALVKSSWAPDVWWECKSYHAVQLSYTQWPRKMSAAFLLSTPWAWEVLHERLHIAQIHCIV